MNAPLSSFSKSSLASLILLIGSVSWALLGAGLQVLATLQLLVPSLAYLFHGLDMVIWRHSRLFYLPMGGSLPVF